MNSGATKSGLSNVEYWGQNGKVKVFALVPELDGGLAAYLESIGVQAIRTRYYVNVYEKNESQLKTIIYWCKTVVKTFLSYCSYHKVKRFIKSIGIDCVYTNTTVTYMGAWLSRYLRAKHIWHFREFGLEDQKAKHISRRFFVREANRAEYIIMISKILQKHYSENFGIKKSYVFYDDISPEYIIEKSKVDDSTTNILITGTLCEKKGQLMAIKAVECLGMDNVNLYLAGRDNPHGYGEGLKKYVQDNHVKNVHFCGLVEDMAGLREKMDISLVCSTKEAFGRIIIEDMLASILVIGSDTGAVPELIENGKTGFLYKNEDCKDLAAKIKYAIYNNSVVEKIKENAYEDALKYTGSITAKRIEELIMR